MDEVARERYTADKEPFFVPLPVQPHFDNLPSDKEKQYAHWISKGAMAGTAIILRQLSPEAEDIYRTIISLHRSCQGRQTLSRVSRGPIDTYRQLRLTEVQGWRDRRGNDRLPQLCLPYCG